MAQPASAFTRYLGVAYTNRYAFLLYKENSCVPPKESPIPTVLIKPCENGGNGDARKISSQISNACT
jgi:hypothetical protein